MILKIHHHSTYLYGSQVYLEPQYFRFKPLQNQFYHLKDFQIKISPEPAGLKEILDWDNNLVHFAWFNELTDSLKIECESVLEITPFNPFNFIIYPEHYLTLPFDYPLSEVTLLRPYLEHVPLNGDIKNFVQKIKDQVNNSTLEFVIALTKKIQEDFDYTIRESGPPYEPEKTFHLKQGACRDLTWLQIQICRAEGIAARFVSGYQYQDQDDPSEEQKDPEVHAWMEVFFESTGWIGFDPSAGIVTNHCYIPVSHSAIPSLTLPVTGTYRGDTAAELNTFLSISKLIQKS
jgi:transglutaminase-like putative cysteine protease